ncbi:MAG: hypothetical protein AB1758_02720 [Candidatus Eremiobacterota bacterium]
MEISWSRPVLALDARPSVSAGGVIPVDRFVAGEARPEAARPPVPPVKLDRQGLERLRRLDFQMARGTCNYFDAEFGPGPVVDNVRAAVGTGPVPVEVARTLAGFAHSCLLRAEAELAPGYRARESVAQDLAWARECLGQLESWWRSGQLQVVRGGKTLAPGSEPLEALVRPQRLAVRRGRLEVPVAPPPPSPEARAMLEELPAQQHVEAPCLARLTGLAASDRKRAAALLGSMLDGLDLVGSGDDMYRACRLIDAAGKSPELREALAPHTARLARIASDAEARGRLAWDFLEGRNKVHVLRSLTRTYPELVDDRLFSEELRPLLLSDELNTSTAASELLRDLWPSAPQWVGPTVDAVIRGEATGSLGSPRGPRLHHEILQAAAEKHAWRPTPEQAAWLVDRMRVPPDQSLFRYEGPAEDYRHVLRATRLISERHPDVFSEKDRRQVLERLLDDPSEKRAAELFAEPPDRVDAFRMLRDVAGFVFPQEGKSPLAQGLLAELEGASLDRLSPRQLSVLAVLGSLRHEPDQERKLADWLSPLMLLEPPAEKRDLDTLGRIAERFRSAHIEACLAAGGVEGLRQAVVTAAFKPDERGWQPSIPDRAVGDVLSRARSLAGDEDARRLLDSLRAVYPGSLSGLTPGQLADVEISEVLTRRRPELRREWRELFGAELSRRYEGRLVAGVVRRLQGAGTEEALDGLRDPLTPAAERLALLDSVPSHEGRKAFRQGLQGEDARGRVAARLSDHDQLRLALQHLGDAPEKWQRFEELHQAALDFEQAMNASRSLESALEAGKDPEEAWRQALLGWVLDSKDGQGGPSDVVRIEDGHVRVGSVRVPLRGKRH